MYLRAEWIQRVEGAFRDCSIVWLKGVRRVGKTVLTRSLPDVAYYDCDLPRTRRLLEDPEGFLRAARGERIVLDEIHRLGNPSEILKIAADHYPEVRIVATGSSTLGVRVLRISNPPQRRGVRREGQDLAMSPHPLSQPSPPRAGERDQG